MTKYKEQIEVILIWAIVIMIVVTFWTEVWKFVSRILES